MKKILKLSIPVLVLITLFFSCSTIGSPPVAASGSDFSTSAVQERGRDLGRDERIVVPGAIDFRSAEYRQLLRTPPLNGMPVFFVAVSRLYDREEEYEMGRRLLARQAALFQKAYVKGKSLTVSNSRYEGSREVVEVDYDRSSLASLYERIRVVEYYEDNNGSYMQGVLTGVRLPDFKIPENGGEDAPPWFTKIPEYPGYLTAAGVSQRQMFFFKSLLESEEQTFLNMARQLSVGVSKERADIEVEGLGSAYQQSSLEEVDTVVRGFYILDRQISRDGNIFYTLAVCPIE